MLDTGQRELIGPDGVALPLSSGEFRLLTALLERPKIALTRNQLLDLTKGRDADLFDRSIDNHVSRLRKKIEPDPKNPRYIKTVWGGGYIFAMDPEAGVKALARSAKTEQRAAMRFRFWPNTLAVQLIAGDRRGGGALQHRRRLLVRIRQRSSRPRLPPMSACSTAPPRSPPP